ncbi:hypothetical protein HZC07_01690, partial [Candidatus Micrarchaeota archaeon]|nr:hypothetical protein [Candidatus Micrarchaeota archaeon]
MKKLLLILVVSILLFAGCLQTQTGYTPRGMMGGVYPTPSDYSGSSGSSGALSDAPSGLITKSSSVTVKVPEGTIQTKIED